MCARVTYSYPYNYCYYSVTYVIQGKDLIFAYRSYRFRQKDYNNVLK